MQKPRNEQVVARWVLLDGMQ